MLYTRSLLEKFAKVHIDAEELANQLTLKVCEVEEIHFTKLPDEVVIWYITDAYQHPNADKLTVCTVNCWAKGTYQICCGASNARKGIYVAVALPWCYLDTIGLAIEPREMRGVESNGMICSKEELWIAEDLEEKWIRALMATDEAPWTARWNIETIRDMDDLNQSDLWMTLKQRYPFLEDWSMDVENKTITHRPDMFGHFWLSVEIKAIAKQAWVDYEDIGGVEEIMKLWQGTQVLSYLENTPASERSFKIESDKVYTYSMTELRNINQRPSWIRLRRMLSSLQSQSNSNRVDLSNIFMHLTWQPVHFFDADKIKWTMTVRFAKEGEKFTDLFWKEHDLISTDIIICDEEKIIDLAWIVWGLNTSVDESTKNIAIEVANFDPVTIRKTGTRLWLRTDAELRFEKNINPLWSLICIKLLHEFLGQNKSFTDEFDMVGTSRWLNESHESFAQKDIQINWNKVGKIIDASIENFEEMWIWVLQDLWCTISWDLVHVPAWRSLEDLETEACLTEEIARIYGYDKIKSLSYSDKNSFTPLWTPVHLQRKLESFLIERMRYDQVETYPWIKSQWIELFDIEKKDLYEMKNGLNPERQYLRPTLLPALIEVLQKNSGFFETIRIFDIWKTWKIGNKEETTLWVLAYRKKLHKDPLTSLFLEGKLLVSEVLEQVQAKWRLTYQLSGKDYFHPVQQAEIQLNGKNIWSIQRLHPYIAESLKLVADGEILLIELSLSTLEEIASSQKKSWSRWSSSYETLQDQILWRDINFVVDIDVPYWLVVNAVSKVKEVKWVEVFDVYSWEQLEVWKKSIAMRLKIVWEEQLQTEQINQVLDKVIEKVEQIWGRLR